MRPFHWAWSFLGLVDILGRTVVLRRRVHRGLAPLWVSLGLFAINLIESVGAVAAAVGSFGSITNI